MIEYEVEIAERPLGVRFAHADRGETVVVHLVLENKVGYKLGLLPGDILIAINGKSVLDNSSASALEQFRAQQLPFSASFRRFEDDDDFDSDEEEQSDTDLRSHFQQEDATSIMHHAASLHGHGHHKQSLSQTMRDWSTADVQEWLENYGRTHFDDADRFKPYQKVFAENGVDGKALRQISKERLKQMGVRAQDIQDLFRGIQQLNSIIFAAPNVGQLANQLKEIGDDGGAEDDAEEDGDGGDDEKQGAEEEDNWEAPFLPYMYDAPTIKLSEKSRVEVYSARVVSPYKKKAFALYELEVAEGKDEWLLSKRYSEFYKLYEAIKKMGVKTKLNFPKKGIFYKSTDKQVMEDRKKKLTEYLNELLKEHPKARDSKELSDFLSPSRTFVVDE